MIQSGHNNTMTVNQINNQTLQQVCNQMREIIDQSNETPEAKQNLKDKKISALELANLIMKSQSEYQRVSNNIWKLVARNILKTDLENEKVTMKSIVEINNGSN